MQSELTQPKVLKGAAPDASGSQDFEDFIYLISHDVRSSVRALLELPQWIAEDLQEEGIQISGSVATSIEMMNRHTGRLDRMLVDLLTFSRVGRMQSLSRNDLNAVIDQVLEEGKLPAGFSVVRQIEVPFVEMGNRDILTLIDALLQNAVKHHDQTTGRIVITSTRQDRELVIGVADDGPGVPEAFREKVFAAMRTLRPRDEVEGSGMGLAIVRKIAGFYQGSVRLTDSPYGRGSLIELRFPLPQPQ